MSISCRYETCLVIRVRHFGLSEAGVQTIRPAHAVQPVTAGGVTKGKKVGIVGLGWLGHMAVKFAHAL